MLYLHNTLSRKKEAFQPLDAANVRMYVCGPTVYDRPHIGNARSVVVYDVLFRVLKYLYPKVTYVRNITDVDDKINARARELGIPIQKLTEETTAQFHADMAALNCLPPTHEPRATQYMKDMHRIIRQLLDNGHAYIADGHVLFDVASYAAYGALSGRKAEEQKAGARVAVEAYKKHPGDFVLWKPSEPGDDASAVFDSPWGKGRPGWHIECSAMSGALLGPTFDIHGGGADLMFPHHENEIAQSRCADAHAEFAKYWVHNGFLTVNGEKMSKSLGNFITVKDLLDKGVKDEVIRYALLTARYNEPLDWTDKLLSDAEKAMNGLYRFVKDRPVPKEEPQEIFLDALKDNLNTPKALAILQAHPHPAMTKAAGNFLGLLQQDSEVWFKSPRIMQATAIATGKATLSAISASTISDEGIQLKIDARLAAKRAKNWAEADKIRKELADFKVILEDRPDGTTDWRRA